MFKKHGFTLVEILLVIVIIGILAAIVIPRITYSKKTAQEQACHSNVAALNAQIELYKMDKGNYPANLTTLTPDYIDAVPTCPVDGTGEANYTIGANSRIDWAAHKTAAGHN